MGVDLKSLVHSKEVSIEDLRDEVLAVDAMNMLYQFLTTIRHKDGQPLTDSKGRVTSHINGLFYRCMEFLEKDLNLVFVFDGEMPDLKEAETKKRREKKEEAKEKYEKAKEEGDKQKMRKYASRMTVLTDDMVEQSKELLEVMGIPTVQAPSEGEAQAAEMTKQDDAYAVLSRDFDNLLFGAETIVRNLSVSGKRKKQGKKGYKNVKAEIISLEDVLNELGINQNQLIVMGVLMGTDFNPGGIHGIGPKTSLKLVKENDDFEEIFKENNWSENFDFGWKKVFDTIKDMPVKTDYDFNIRRPDTEKIKELMIEEYEFSEKRIGNRIEKYKEVKEKQKQSSLGKWN